MGRVRGNEIAIICQNPSTVLNPVFTIGSQLREVFSFHREIRDRKPASYADEKILSLLREVHIPQPEMQLKNYPFRLSGGMIQRIVTAMGLLCEPQVIIADEPTTALDVTIQAGILKLLKNLRDKYRTSILFITHDFGVVARLCDSVAVMYTGRIVEYNEVKDLFRNPRHPYTQGLIRSIPLFGKKKKRLHSMAGQPPDLTNLPQGCFFYPRCEERMPICKREYPPRFYLDEKSFYHCWLHHKGEKFAFTSS
jgi:oligopeptide/dipeptide ABC transporter ATP-binding protein